MRDELNIHPGGIIIIIGFGKVEGDLFRPIVASLLHLTYLQIRCLKSEVLNYII